MAAVAFAPFIGDLGGIYFFIQTLLSLFQGPMLALLVLGAFTFGVTAIAGVVTIVTGVALAAILMSQDMNMLYVAFSTFLYSLTCLVVVSLFTPAKAREEIKHLVYRYG